MKELFIGREQELDELNEMYSQNKFQLFVLYGRRTGQLHMKPFNYLTSSEFFKDFLNINFTFPILYAIIHLSDFKQKPKSYNKKESSYESCSNI